MSATLAPRAHDAEVGARFDAAAARFKVAVPPNDARLAALVRTLGPGLAGQRVLDLGCGKGRFARALAALGAEVVGVDLSASMLAEASGFDRARASARSLPFAESVFDVVVAVEVLEHVGAVEPVLREARRVLRPGGRLLVVDKNAHALDHHRPWLPALAVKWLDTRRGRWMYPAGGPVAERWFAPGRLRRAMARAGFAELGVEFLLSRSERDRWVFRLIPRARLMTLWSGVAR